MKKPALHSNNQRGQAIVLIAMVMVVLVASLGLAIDGGGMFLLYRDVQNATDAAALTASFSLCTSEDAQTLQAATAQSARQNGFVDGVDGATVNIENPPLSGNFAGDPQYVRVEIIAEKPAYFIQVVYNGPLRVSASTTAQCINGNNFGFPPDTALASLRNTCPNANNDIGVQGRGNTGVSIYGTIFSNMPDGCKGFDIRGSAQWLVTGEICTDGSIDTGAIGDLLGNPADETRPCPYEVTNTTDPLGLSTQPPQCDRSVDLGPLSQYETARGNGPAPAGYYSDFSTGSNRAVILQSGIFCTDGDIDLKGAISNEPGGVTIYQDCTTCSVSTNAGASNNLKASSSGPYAGLLLYSTSQVTTPNQGIGMNGGAGSDFSGTIYAPGADCSIQGNVDLTVIAQFICWNAGSEGTSEINIFYVESAFYKVPPSYGITE